MKIAIPMILAVVLASAASAAPAGTNNPQDLINLENAWAKAAVTRDSAALNRIVAPDWHGQNQRGQFTDRATMVHQAVAGSEKLSAEVNHDLHVRFLGNDHAVVQGMDDETGITNGKTVHEVYSWTDVYEKRGGSWVAVASQNTKLK